MVVIFLSHSLTKVCGLCCVGINRLLCRHGNGGPIPVLCRDGIIPMLLPTPLKPRTTSSGATTAALWCCSLLMGGSRTQLSDGALQVCCSLPTPTQLRITAAMAPLFFSCTLVQSTWWPAALFALAADSDGFEPFSQLLASAR